MSSQLISSDIDRQIVALTGRTLGALFYYGPDQASVQDLYLLLQDSAWSKEWPCGQPDELSQIAALMQKGLAQKDGETLNEVYQRLFVGPNSLQAPPWGSVYLDHENVIFGESTVALRQWQQDLGIEVLLQQREPEDHIGLLLMHSSWLAENEPEQLSILLEKHVLTWSSRYLSLLKEHAHHSFFQALAQLTQITLDDWQQRLSVTPEKKQIFF